jgi:hypothetical protein
MLLQSQRETKARKEDCQINKGTESKTSCQPSSKRRINQTESQKNLLPINTRRQKTSSLQPSINPILLPRPREKSITPRTKNSGIPYLIATM